MAELSVSSACSAVSTTVSRTLATLPLLLVLTSTLSAQTNPYLHLRDSTLGYHGPDPDLSHLPETRIGWFGPTNTTDTTGADMWTAANLALKDFSSTFCPVKPPLCRGDAPNESFQSKAPTDRHDSLKAVPPTSLSPPHSALRSPLSPLPSPLSPISLLPRWSADPWGSGVSQLARMVYQDQPVALLGSIDSASTHLAEQIVAKANLPLLSPITTDPSVTLAGVPWMFSCAPSDDAVARALVQDILQILDASPGTLALLTTTDHESRMTTRAVLRELNRRQRSPDFRFDLTPGTSQLDPQSQALQKAQPHALLIIANPTNAARLTRLARTLPSPPPHLFGTPAMARQSYRDLAGPHANGVRFPTLASPDPRDPNTASFIQRFTLERGHLPDDTAFLTYDATRLLLHALQISGRSRAQLRQTLASLGPWQGLSGFIHFDGTGQNTRTNIQMATYHNDNRPLEGRAPASPTSLLPTPKT